MKKLILLPLILFISLISDFAEAAQSVFTDPAAGACSDLAPANTGNGTCTITNVSAFNVTETITLTATTSGSGATFSVTGSLSGVLTSITATGSAIAVVDAYGFPKFSISLTNGGVAYVAGDNFTFALTQGTELRKSNFDLFTLTEVCSNGCSPNTAILGGSGTVGNPTYSFSSDTGNNTGIYRIGEDNLGATVGGVKMLDIASTGLSVTGKVSAGGATDTLSMIKVTGNTLSTTNQVAFYAPFTSTSAATASTRGIYIDLATSASAYTTGFMSAFMGGITAGAGSIATYGILFDGSNGFAGAGTITNRAWLSDNQTFSGTRFISQTGTAVSSFAGAIAHTRTDVASTATITALTSSTGFVKLTGSTATAIQGITAGIDGQCLKILNLTGQNMTIQNENAGATAVNRITTMTGADVATTGNGSSELCYDTGSSRWAAMYVTP